MTNHSEPSGAQKAFRDFAPAFVEFTDEVLSARSGPDRAVTQTAQPGPVSVLAALGATEQLTYHLDLAKQNGNTETELKEAITHITFYAGWPWAMSAMTVAKQAFGD
jgi:4-carboxymuconolactone decarboxylase